MYSNQLEKEGRKHVPGFVGVYSLDNLPRFYSKPRIPYRFIVNTHTMNLPGEHWIAISFEARGIVLAFDPLGFYYPLYLTKYLKKKGRKVHFNRHQYQKPGTTICGQMCLAFLKSLKTISTSDMIAKFS